MANYKTKKEKIFTGEELEFIKLGEEKNYILISKDRDKITYQAQKRTYNFKDQKEKVRAYFLVKLIDKYKYSEKRIHLDVEVPGQKPLVTADLVVFKDSLPYIVVECQKKGILKSEVEKTIQTVIEKAKILKAGYAVAVIGSQQIVFKVEKGAKKVRDVPKNYT